MTVGKADLHIHTLVSDGLATVGETLQYIEQRTDLDVVAITDHEDVGGGLRARELARRREFRFEVVVGAEITTLQGHVLALFVEQAPKSFRPLDRTIAEIHAQGGLAVVPHPMSWLTRSVGAHAIDRIGNEPAPDVYIDAVETHNPSVAGRVTAERARAAARRWGFASTGGSDAHHLAHIGTAWTEFPGRSAEDLYRAITLGTTRGVQTGYPGVRAVGLRQIALGLAWGYAATPRKMARGMSGLLPTRWRNNR